MSNSFGKWEGTGGGRRRDGGRRGLSSPRDTCFDGGKVVNYGKKIMMEIRVIGGCNKEGIGKEGSALTWNMGMRRVLQTIIFDSFSSPT